MLLSWSPSPGHTPPTVEDLREFLLARGMPIQKTPERVVAVEPLPMTATGKVQTRVAQRHRTALQAEAAQSQEVSGAR